MRQAVTKLILGLCLVLAPPAWGESGPAADEAPIARARRLIRDGDRAAAVTLLEDTLAECPAADRPALLVLLRQSYEALAREAEAAGRADDAAEYRDNLSILDRAPETAPRDAKSPPRTQPAKPRPQPAKPDPRPAKPRVEPTPAPARKDAGPPAAPPRDAIAPAPEAVRPPVSSGPPDLRAPRLGSALPEPQPLPEPARVSMPAPMPQVSSPAPAPAPKTGMSRVPRARTPTIAAPSGTRELPISRDGAPALSPGPDGREMPINPGDATAASAPGPPRAAPDAARPGAGSVVASGIPVNRAPAAGPVSTNEADRLFRARRFDESGRLYAALAKRNQLPAERRPHWAYCRFEAVVRRINARPRSAREWDEIEAEVRSIQRLTPGNWYAEYLINKIAEARHGRRRPAASSDGMVVRGSAPEEPSPQRQPETRSQPPAPAPSRRRIFGRSRGPAAVTEQPANPAEGLAPDQTLNLPGNLPAPDPRSTAGAGDEPKPDPAGAPAPESAEVKSRSDDASKVVDTGAANESGAIAWQVHETPNFRIYHCDPALAERAGAVAEAVRTEQAKRWKSPATRAAWSPRCELYLYPTARSYAEATGQPINSPGISAMSNNGVRVISRRMNLRADNPLMLTATLPHEVTHIVLADLFIARMIPRWADEGIAVLAEPASERHFRQADLKEPLDAGHVFTVGQLMTMDYPDPKDWRLFYAQSVSLTLFLVEQGPPERFIQFVRDSQRMGPEAALRDIYQIDGVTALQERWLDYARKHVAVDVATSRDAGTATDGVSRE